MLNNPDVIALFDKYKVLNPRELHGRYEIYLEQYSKTVNVEAKLTAHIGKTIILPTALRYQGEARRHRGQREGDGRDRGHEPAPTGLGLER